MYVLANQVANKVHIVHVFHTVHVIAKVAEEREREMRESLEQQRMAVFETVNEQEDRLRRERGGVAPGEVAVNFNLLKPHPQFIYHTTLPEEGDGDV